MKWGDHYSTKLLDYGQQWALAMKMRIVTYNQKEFCQWSTFLRVYISPAIQAYCHQNFDLFNTMKKCLLFICGWWAILPVLTPAKWNKSEVHFFYRPIQRQSEPQKLFSSLVFRITNFYAWLLSFDVPSRPCMLADSSFKTNDLNVFWWPVIL